ncbi:MAG: family transcriptional regulator, regulator of embCAB operon [Actinomycetota bacterium]|jgi:DNA-binding SARP family transcriptional activator|nr:family transcriptional regulator, regulator of embCAB operon [Actinomycetota bacterium]
MTGRPELSLLGSFAFSVSGQPLPKLSAGSQRLLALLALRRHVMTRAQVAGTLWPESTDERAGSSLRSAIARLPGPAHQALRLTTHELSLDEDIVVVDVHRSYALAHRLIDDDGPPDERNVGDDDLSALSQDLLPGWYDDWALIAAEDWRQLRVRALEALAARLGAADRLAEAKAAARAAVQAEPLRESARGALIRVHLAEGDESEAVAAFESYRSLLQAELRIEPTPRLRQLLPGNEPG